ncbi:hypothetical protein Pst134EA_007370 [Puccinia striiformis f. sp. tritici]|uniref:hypothetical protein n=1 Tax=Puccinia striiformis f. sp. tritici TaxID=168172 RepID=UPI002007AD4B|nr:hypothetical protein Pst134EA_007370 [Puccinia striiformis f. sp. tritici]KAH9470104.1 hypothetical protein Pst134EA_007370 [Puccinia striiformis f. sp. tritici]
MSSTRSSGNSLLPVVDPEALLCNAAAERRQQSKILANSTEPSIHVPSTSYPSTSFHTPNTSSPGTPPERPFTPSLLLNSGMPDPPNPTDLPSPGGSSSSKSATKNPIADDYVELLLKLQHTAALQLQDERQYNIEQRRADRDRIVRLKNTLFDVVTKAEEEKTVRLTPSPKSNRIDLQKFRIADGPSFKGTLHDIEPFLKWITQLQIFFSTKGVTDDDDKICITGGLLKNTMLLDFYVSKGPTFAGKSWDEFKNRLFEVALPQRWRTTLKTKLRQLTMGPKETFIAFSGRARTLQTLINFDNTSSPTPPSPRLSDFDLAEFVVLGVIEELRADIAKFAVLDADPFSYPAFEKRVAVFDKNTIRSPPPRASRGAPSNHSPSNSPADPAAWRVHAYLDSQGQCHHCKTACGSTPGNCTKPLNKRWVDIPESFQTPRRPIDYQPPKAQRPPTSTAGKPTHPPAGRPPFRSTSLAAITDSTNDSQPPSNTDYVDVVDAVDADELQFGAAAEDDNLPPDLTATDWATFQEIDNILSDTVAGIEEDVSPACSSTYCSDLGRDPFDNTPSSP